MWQLSCSRLTSAITRFVPTRYFRLESTGELTANLDHEESDSVRQSDGCGGQTEPVTGHLFPADWGTARGAAAPVRCVSLVNVRDGLWSALSGVFTARYDEPLTELGRSSYHGNVLAADVLPSATLSVVDRYIFGVVWE